MHSVAEAVARIVEGIAPLAVESVGLGEALGRVLAADVRSPITLPHWANSAMDGYAVRGVDIAGARAESPVTLPVLETIAAGAFPTRALGAGEATRIMTGAPIPEGADTVVRVEDTDAGLTEVQVRNDRDREKNIRRRGEDLTEGTIALPVGMPLGAAQIGLVDVDRFDEVRAGRKIVSSNAYTLDALVRLNGGIPIALGHAVDTREAMRALLERALAKRPDLIVTSAGVSVGEFDHTRAALEEMGAKMALWRVRMRPGAPVGFGTIAGIPWLGLPGNPVSVMVTFELFVRPTIRRMLGHTRLHRRSVAVTLEEPVRIGAKLTHFLRAIVTTQPDGSLTARLTGPQGSGILTSMSLANALLVIPEDRPEVSAGERLSALLLTEDASTSATFAL